MVYYSPDEKGEKAYQELWGYCSKMNLPLKPTKLKAPFDLIKTANEIRKDLKAYAKKDIIFNITGGTKVMASGALLACILEGKPAVYCNEKTGKEEPLPLMQIKYEDFLSEQQRKILKIIKELGEKCTAVAVAKKAALKKATVSHHIKELEDRGLITIETSKEDSRKKFLKISESVELLVSD